MSWIQCVLSLNVTHTWDELHSINRLSRCHGLPEPSKCHELNVFSLSTMCSLSQQCHSHWRQATLNKSCVYMSRTPWVIYRLRTQWVLDLSVTHSKRATLYEACIEIPRTQWIIYLNVYQNVTNSMSHLMVTNPMSGLSQCYTPEASSTKWGMYGNVTNALSHHARAMWHPIWHVTLIHVSSTSHVSLMSHVPLRTMRHLRRHITLTHVS